MTAGLVGLTVTLVARRSRVYRLLAQRYQETEPPAPSREREPRPDDTTPAMETG